MKKSILIASCTVIEWFDFVIFVYLTPYMSSYFLPETTDVPTKNLIMLALMLIPYVLRPFGGVLLGLIADKLEKKSILLITVRLMALSTIGVIFIPSYQTLGFLAIALLLLCRIIQAFSIGGEYVIAAVMLYGTSPQHKKYFYTSFINVSTVFGSLLGIIFVSILIHIIPANLISAKYWKIPFVVTSLLFIVVWYIRKVNFGVLKQDKSPVKAKDFNLYTLLLLFFYLMFGGVGYYFFVVMGKSILIHAGLSETTSSYITFLGMISLMVAILVASFFADKYNVFKMQIVGIILVIVFAGLYKYILLHNILVLSIISQIILGGMLALYLGPMPAFMSYIMPSNIRCTGLGFIYNFALSIFGALTPLIIVFLLQKHNYGDILYLIIAGLVSITALILLKYKHANT